MRENSNIAWQDFYQKIFLNKILDFGSVCIKLFNQICRVCAQRWRFLHHCTDGKTSWALGINVFTSFTQTLASPSIKCSLFCFWTFFDFFSAIFSTLLHLLKSRAIGVKESLFVPFLSPFPKDPRTRTHTKKSVFCILHDRQKCIGIHTDINCRKIIFGLLFFGFRKVPEGSKWFWKALKGFKSLGLVQIGSNRFG